jgi:signal transduction histidine kinase
MSPTVKIEIDENLSNVHMSPSRAYQVFKNLISNSLKFGQLEAPLHIHVGRSEETGKDIPGRHAAFFVKDNGIGIEKQLHEEIFRLFFRSRKSEAKGTGVGLAIVKRIVEGDGGSIRVESDRGQGAAFYFSLPTV